MKKIALLCFAFLIACTSAPATTAPPPATTAPPPATTGGTVENVLPHVDARMSELNLAAAAPIAHPYKWLPAASGALDTACRYTDAGYKCPTTPQAVLASAAWVPTEAGATILFPITLEPGSTISTVRGFVACMAGDSVRMNVGILDPDHGWASYSDAVYATCNGGGEYLDVSGPFAADDSGFRLLTATFRVDKFGCVTENCNGDGASVSISGVELGQ